MNTPAIRHITLRIRQLPPTADGFRIVHLSDLHLRRWNALLENLQESLATLAYDMLAITGDFCDWPTEHKTAADLTRRLLDPVHPPLGIFGVLGNHDAAEFAEHDLPLTLLRNDSRRITVGPFSFDLGGVDQSHRYRSSLSEVQFGFEAADAQVVLAHFPSTAFEMPAAAEAIMLAGHTHGGQIRLPGLGCFYVRDDIPLGMARGLHQVRGNWLHVSAGIGVAGPIRTRFCCPPELSVLTLRCRSRRESGRDSHQPAEEHVTEALIC